MKSDLVSRQAAIDALADYIHNVDKVYSTGHLSMSDCEDAARSVIEDLPSAQPEVIYCKDCRKHNVHSGYKDDCCPLYEWRGMSYGHEHDYQYCSFAERRTDD